MQSIWKVLFRERIFKCTRIEDSSLVKHWNSGADSKPYLLVVNFAIKGHQGLVDILSWFKVKHAKAGSGWLRSTQTKHGVVQEAN